MDSGDRVQGVRLLGWDIPTIISASEEKLRVIAAVECCDPSLAPAVVAVVVRYEGPADFGNRVCSVKKYLPSDGTGVAVGLAADFVMPGEHTIKVMVCEVGESGDAESVLFETTRTCVKEAVHERGPLPRLQYSDEDSLALCGVDVPATVDLGKMRVIVALKRTWHDAPSQLALIVRDLCPDGTRRAAVVRKIFGDDADTIGLEVPMGEAGVHILTVQVAKVVDGEMVEVFRMEREVLVTNPPPPVLAENEGLVLRGVEIPTSVNGSMRAIVALQRMNDDAPRNLCLIARNTFPDGSKRAAMVCKVLDDIETQAVGIEVPMGMAGDNWVEFSVCECTEDGNVEIFLIPARLVTVTNPPAPRIQQTDAVVLCGVDICGARWPDLCAEPVVNGTGRVMVAVCRMWEDAPTEFIMTVHDVYNGRSAVMRKSINSCIAETIGLEVPMKAAGGVMLVVSVSAQYADGSMRHLFEVPAVTVDVHDVILPPAVESPIEVDFEPFSEPEIVDGEEGYATEEYETESPFVSREETVSLKVGYHSGSEAEACVIRRLSVTFGVDAKGKYIDPMDTLMAVLTRAFTAELDADTPTQLTDSSGDKMTRDEDISAVLLAPSKGGVIRLAIRQ